MKVRGVFEQGKNVEKVQTCQPEIKIGINFWKIKDDYNNIN